LRGVIGVIVLSVTALAAGAAEAVPVPLMGIADFSTERQCAPFCGSTDVTANIIGVEGSWIDGQFHGGGAAQTSAALGGGGLFGKAAAAVVQFEWASLFWAVPEHRTDEPFDLLLDSDLTLFASHSALLGSASGGVELEIEWFQCFGLSCELVFSEQRIYNETLFVEEKFDLGLFDPSGFGVLQVTFNVGSAVSTLPIIGVFADAFDLGTLDFTFRADDGQAPPKPVPEPSGLGLMLAGLPVLGLMRRRRSARQGAAALQ
jgi:hypothetical protein